MKYRTLSLESYEQKLRNDPTLTNAERGEYFKAMAELLVSCQGMRLSVQWAQRAQPMFWQDLKVITLNRKSASKTIVHDFLHEYGHAKLTKVSRFDDNWGVDSKGVHLQLNALNEEFEAWHEGREFGKKHALQLDWRMYDRSADHNLMMYVTWAARRGSKQKRWV